MENTRKYSAQSGLSRTLIPVPITTTPEMNPQARRCSLESRDQVANAIVASLSFPCLFTMASRCYSLAEQQQWNVYHCRGIQYGRLEEQKQKGRSRAKINKLVSK